MTDASLTRSAFWAASPISAPGKAVFANSSSMKQCDPEKIERMIAYEPKSSALRPTPDGYLADQKECKCGQSFFIGKDPSSVFVKIEINSSVGANLMTNEFHITYSLSSKDH